MGLNKGWNNIPKKILAAGLSLMMIGGSHGWRMVQIRTSR